MEPEEVLKQFNMTDTETKVYLGLLKLGETTVPEIVKVINVYKANVYDALDRLEKRGLVTHIKKENIMIYSPLNPEKLFEILDSRKSDLESIFPILNKYYMSKKTDREVNIISGRDGLKTIFNDIYNSKNEIFMVGSALQLFSTMEHRAIQFLNLLEKNNFKVNVIVVDKKEVRDNVCELKKYITSAKVKFYPEQYFSPVSSMTYGDKTVIIIWEDNPLLIWIKDTKISDAFKNYFSIIWSASKE